MIDISDVVGANVKVDASVVVSASIVVDTSVDVGASVWTESNIVVGVKVDVYVATVSASTGHCERSFSCGCVCRLSIVVFRSLMLSGCDSRRC